MQSKFDIADEWTQGFVAGLVPALIPPCSSEHWQAGYAQGYRQRRTKASLLNEYLVSVGCQPMGIVQAQAEEPKP